MSEVSGVKYGGTLESGETRAPQKGSPTLPTLNNMNYNYQQLVNNVFFYINTYTHLHACLLCGDLLLTQCIPLAPYLIECQTLKPSLSPQTSHSRFWGPHTQTRIRAHTLKMKIKMIFAPSCELQFNLFLGMSDLAHGGKKHRPNCMFRPELRQSDMKSVIYSWLPVGNTSCTVRKKSRQLCSNEL